MVLREVHQDLDVRLLQQHGFAVRHLDQVDFQVPLGSLLGELAGQFGVAQFAELVILGLDELYVLLLLPYTLTLHPPFEALEVDTLDRAAALTRLHKGIVRDAFVFAETDAAEAFFAHLGGQGV